MEPGPPHITIVDPNSPSSTDDVLVSGGDPWRPRMPRWRPTSRQVRRTGVVLLLLALLAAGVRDVLSRYLDARADKAAVEEIRLAFTDEQTRASGDLTLTDTHIGLVSGGRHPVTLTALQMVGGSASGHLDLTVDRTGSDLTLPAGKGCLLADLRKPPTALRLTLRTYRGTSVERTLTLSEADAKQFAQTERMRCGYPPPEFALGLEIDHSEAVGRTLVIHYLLLNGTPGDLVVTGLRLAPGLSASGFRLPLRVMPNGGRPDAAPRETLRVRVSDCRAFRLDQARPEHREPYFTVTVKDTFGTATTDVGFNSDNNGIEPTEVYATDAFRSWCGMPLLY